MVYTAWINSEGTPFQILLANMNNCLSLENEKIIQNFCQILGIPLEVRQIQSELKLDFSFEKNGKINEKSLFICCDVDKNKIYKDFLTNSARDYLEKYYFYVD
jgi:hypothetical protein